MEFNTGNTAIWSAGRFHWDLTQKGLIMGILNVTPDSFSDGGQYQYSETAIRHGLKMISEGADILDIGGESTRPSADVVPLEEELARVIPVIEGLHSQTSCALSIDTTKPEVARAALRAGADIVNDISGFRDPEMIEVCAASDCGLVAMHMKGRPQTMQREPVYEDVVEEVCASFQSILGALDASGIDEERILFDPGIGFGKLVEHNLQLLRSLPELRVNQRPLLMGLSRKSFIGHLIGDLKMNRRESPTISLTAYTRALGALVHRVHSVKENREALRMIEAVL